MTAASDRFAPPTVDVVVLSRCTGAEDFRTNQQCIRSLLASEPDVRFRTVVVESNRDFAALGLTYDEPDVALVVPDEPFRFNRFLNIGLDRTQAPWIVFSNNDVVYHPGWFSALMQAGRSNPDIRSFCPFDRRSPYLSFGKYRRKSVHFGYRVPIEFVGWCFIVERPVFDKTGPLDERYDLYFGDNDFARTLERESVLHAMVPGSFVGHIGGYTTGQYDASGTPEYARDRDRYLQKWGPPKRTKPLRALIRRLLGT